MRRHPESLLISAVLRTGDYALAVRHGASHRLFHVHADEWSWIEKQFDKGRRCPSKSSFKHQFPEFVLVRNDDVLTALDLVKKSHARYETQRFMNEAVELIEADKADEAVKLIARRSANLSYEIEHNADAIDVVTDWEDTFDVVSARIDRAEEHGQSGVPTGFGSLDTITGGMQPGWLTIVAARLGVGKTWHMIKMAYTAVASGHSVLFFSLEQSRHQIAMRMQALAAADLGYALNPGQLTHGIGLDREMYREILEAISETLTGQFYVNDQTRGRVGLKTIEAAIEAKEPDLVVVDYITLLKRAGNEWMDVAQLSGDMKVMAEEYAVPFITASQLNRSGTGADPGAEHIAQSDAIGQDADLVLTLTQTTEHLRRMKLIKNRHGSSGVGFPIHFDPSRGIIKEISGNEAAEISDQDLDED